MQMELAKIAHRVAAEETLILEGPFEILENVDDYIEVEEDDLEIPGSIVEEVKKYLVSQGVTEEDFEVEGGEEKEDSPIYFHERKVYLREGKLQLDKDEITISHEPADPSVGVSENVVLDGVEVNAIANVLLKNPEDVKRATRFYDSTIKSDEEAIVKKAGGFDEPDYDPPDDDPPW